MLNKGLDAVTNVKRSNWYDSVVADFLVAPSFPCHQGFCNWTNKLTRFPLFWGLVYDLSNKLVLAQVSIAANTELLASQATGPSCTLSTQPHGNSLLGSSWFWCYVSSPGCKLQPQCPPWGLPHQESEELGLAGASVAGLRLPGITSCNWSSSYSWGRRVQNHLSKNQWPKSLVSAAAPN